MNRGSIHEPEVFLPKHEWHARVFLCRSSLGTVWSLGHHWRHLYLKAVLTLLELCPDQVRISFSLVNEPSDELKFRSSRSCSVYLEIIVCCSHILHHWRTNRCRLSCTRTTGPDWQDRWSTHEAKVSRWLLLAENRFHLTSESSSKFTIIYIF